MKCPHCLTDFHDSSSDPYLGDDADGRWHIVKRTCSACKRFIFHLRLDKPIYDHEGKIASYKEAQLTQVRPKGSSRPPCPPQVDPKFAEDYNEACLVFPDSPKASAALSRRCVQNILRDKVGITVKSGNLADEIQALLDTGSLPTYIAQAIDAVRQIGNFAAHPMKSQSTGEILPVEPGEAEWNLDVLETLFDFYFVQPDILQQKRAALNLKLADAGKAPMK